MLISCSRDGDEEECSEAVGVKLGGITLADDVTFTAKLVGSFSSFGNPEKDMADDVLHDGLLLLVPVGVWGSLERTLGALQLIPESETLSPQLP